MKFDRTDKLSALLVRIVLVLVPFYALISVWVASGIGHFTAVRLWDDLILLLLVVVTIIYVAVDRLTLRYMARDWISRLIAAYIVLTLLLGLIGFLDHNVSLKALFYGLLVNLRYLVWFACIRIVAAKSTLLGKHYYRYIFYPMALVVLFGLLQFFILPHTFLSHFGYGQGTYPQYITINQNNPTIRIQSFLRGPNPLGAYLAATLCILAAFLVKTKKRLWPLILFAASLIAIYLTFSRSAIIGLVFGLVVIFYVLLKSKKQRIVFAGLIVAACLILGIAYAATKNNQTVQDILLHHNSHSTAVINSDQGHLTALKNNIEVAIHEPLGKGPGTSGQATWYNTRHSVVNPEDYFIQISEEVGWLGLALFVAILSLVGYHLWLQRRNPLALGLLGGLAAIIVISLFSYTWSDDTLSYLWWGLAGVCLPLKLKLQAK